MAYQLPDSPVRLYLGSKAILARLGYHSPKMLERLIVREGLPCYKRNVKTSTTCYRAWQISESAVSAWEIAKGQQYVNRLRQRREAKQEKTQYALTV